MGGEAVEAACTDDGSDQGMDAGAPDRAQAVREFGRKQATWNDDYMLSLLAR